MTARKSFLIVPLLCLAILSCANDNTKKDEAQKDILVATLFRISECGPGSGPAYPLPVLKDQDTNAVAGCVIAIVNEPCPFLNYPLLCIRVFGENVPGTVKIVKQ